MIPDSDKRSLETLASDIMNLDPRIYACTIVSNPEGSTIVRVVRAEFRHSLTSHAQESDGMAGHWAIRAFNAMERLDAIRSKAKFIAVGRETNQTMIFPVSISDNLMVIMTIGAKTESTEIFEIVTRFIQGSNLILTV